METKKYQIINIVEPMRSMVEEIFKTYNKCIQVLNNESDKPLVIHSNTKQMTYVLDGKGHVIVDYDIYEIGQGDLVLLEEKQSHSFICTEGEMQLLHLHFPENNVENDRIVLKDFIFK